MAHSTDPLKPVPNADQGWSRVVANLISGLGSPDFSEGLFAAVAHLCALDSMIVTRHHGTTAPQVIHHDLDDIQAAISVSFYSSGPYLLDPFFIACRENRSPGAYRLMEIAPETFFRSEYFRTFYLKIRISDEMALLIQEGKDRWIVVSLARRLGQPKFSVSDVARINAVFDVFSAAILKQWGDVDEPKAMSIVEMDTGKFDSFGADILSPREAQIMRLILLGHSTPTAAAYLGIAEGTVKVHRRHAYAKLGITSQSELFALATQFLASTYESSSD